MKKLISKLSLSLIAPSMILSGAFAQTSTTVDVASKLQLREKFYTDFLEVQRDMNDIAKNEALKAWYGVKAKSLRLPKYRLAQVQALGPYVKSQKVIDWAGYYHATGQFAKTASILSSYNYMLAAYVSELATDPRDDGNMTRVKRKAKELVAQGLASAKNAEVKCAANAPSAGSLSALAQSCLSEMQTITSFVTETLNEKFFRGSNQVLSLTGLIDGNKVEQILENFYEAKFINYMAPMTKAVINNYKGMSVEDFKSKMASKESALTDFFNEKDGFPVNARDHEVWKPTKAFVGQPAKKNIYGQVMQAIVSAKQSVFIDVFFIGGSIGATLAKSLIQKVQTDKNFWVYILNDRNNPLGYNPEMEPVYNYLRAYAEKFAEDRIVLLTPDVDKKRTAFPAIADIILKDATLQATLDNAQRAGLVKQLSFYPKGKSDHSKVIVVDGTDKDHGVAFVGSKNFTDSSGGVAYDEVTQIQGPAVPAILDSYYYDLTMALRLANEKAPNYLADLYSKNYKGTVDLNTQIQKLLSKVDVLNRSKISTVSDLKNWPAKGSAPVMIGENNAYGTIRTALPQVIAGIRSADKQIIISEQFIYEPSVVRALKDQVELKIPTNPDFQVFIVLADMADHFNPAKEFSHIPNVSFVDEFTGSRNIHVKWKKVPKLNFEALAEIKKSHDLSYAPEYHLKSLSIDGVLAAQAGQCATNKAALVSGLKSATKLPLLISGSANKDVMTMTGGFREYQVVVYDHTITVDHDCQFWSRYLNSDETTPVDVKTMNLPANLKGKGLNETRFNQLVRDIVNGAYNVMTGYMD